MARNQGAVIYLLDAAGQTSVCRGVIPHKRVVALAGTIPTLTVGADQIVN